MQDTFNCLCYFLVQNEGTALIVCLELRVTLYSDIFLKISLLEFLWNGIYIINVSSTYDECFSSPRFLGATFFLYLSFSIEPLHFNKEISTSFFYLTILRYDFA